MSGGGLQRLARTTPHVYHLKAELSATSIYNRPYGLPNTFGWEDHEVRLLLRSA